jgi:hypothetical protein
VYSGEVALILHALRAAPADHGAASHRLADVLAAEAALGEERRCDKPPSRLPGGMRRLALFP